MKAPSAAKAPRYASLEQAREYIACSRTTLERRIAQGRLTRYTNGRRVLVDLNELDELVQGRR